MEFNAPTTAEYAEAFGVELPAEGPVVTEPVVTEPATQPVEPPAEPVTELPAEPPVEPVTEPDKDPMTPEERSMWAARRRRREAKERQAIEEAKERQAIAEAAQARVDQVYADIFKGQNNPLTGKPIATEADYKAFIAERDRRQQEEQLQKAGIDPKTIQGLVDQQMAPLRQQMETARLAAIQEKAKAANARFEAALNAELQKVTAMDPAIKTVQDIAAMKTAPEFNRYVQMGLGIEDAFYLANRAEVDARKMAAARAAMQEQLAGKGHLNPVAASGGKAPVQVPRGVVETYRAMFPEATDEEIQKAYESAYKT